MPAATRHIRLRQPHAVLTACTWLLSLGTLLFLAGCRLPH